MRETERGERGERRERREREREERGERGRTKQIYYKIRLRTRRRMERDFVNIEERKK